MDPKPGENHLKTGMVSVLDYVPTGKGVKAKPARGLWEDARRGQAKLVCLIDAQAMKQTGLRAYHSTCASGSECLAVADGHLRRCLNPFNWGSRFGCRIWGIGLRSTRDHGAQIIGLKMYDFVPLAWPLLLP